VDDVGDQRRYQNGDDIRGWKAIRMVDAYSDTADTAIIPEVLAPYGLPPHVDPVEWLETPTQHARDYMRRSPGPKK
jgi:hypothetical protein